MNDEYIPKPSSSATVLVVQTPRMRIIFMSTSGSALWVSLYTQAASTSSPDSITTSVSADSQPQLGVLLTAISTAPRPTAISSALTQFTRPGTRTGDSGT